MEHGTQQKAIYKPWSRSSPSRESVSTLILDFSASRIRNRPLAICKLPSLQYFVIAAQTAWDKELSADFTSENFSPGLAMLSLYFTTYTHLGLCKVLRVWTSGNPLWVDCLSEVTSSLLFWKVSGQSCRHWSSAQLQLRQPQWEMEGICCIRSFKNRVFTLHRASAGYRDKGIQNVVL